MTYQRPTGHLIWRTKKRSIEKQNEQSLRLPQDNIQSSLCRWDPWEKRKRLAQKNRRGKGWLVTFMKNTNSTAWRWANAGRANPKRSMPRRIRNRCMKTKDKRRRLELSQRAAYDIYGTPLPRTADVRPEARRRTRENTTAKPACHTHDTRPPGLRHSETKGNGSCHWQASCKAGSPALLGHAQALGNMRHHQNGIQKNWTIKNHKI